jgi:hypothetical protein
MECSVLPSQSSFIGLLECFATKNFRVTSSTDVGSLQVLAGGKRRAEGQKAIVGRATSLVGRAAWHIQLSVHV